MIAKPQNPSLKWIVVLAFSGAEWQAYTNLLRHGVRAFLPYTLGSSRRGRWLQGVVRPQFPGYLFAAIGDGVSLETIKRTLGVHAVLMAKDGLVYVSAAQIALCRKNWLKAYREARPRRFQKVILAVGDFVAVPHGPFIGAPCQIKSLDKSGRVCASLGQLQVTFHISDVAAKSVRASAKPETATISP